MTKSTVKVRDLTFASVEECAEYFKLTTVYVRHMIKTGRGDRVGLGKSCPKKRQCKMQVMVRGQVFANAKECAAHFGVSVSHVYASVCQGKQDGIGLGKGHKPPKNPNYGGGRSKPIDFAGFKFPSLAAASRYLGWRPKRLENVLRKAGPIQTQYLYAALMKLPLGGDTKGKEK